VSHAKPIYLVGMMGVGKSTVGIRLAERLARRFLDTDQEIERSEGRSIPVIFAEDGESRFRALESALIERLASGETESKEGAGFVVALGGGAIAQPGAVERLLSSGEVVFLAAEPEQLLDRIGSDSNRPLLAGLDPEEQLEKLRALMRERMPFYRCAQHHVEASGGADEIVDRIIDRLKSD
jgi:shikimate kinase